MTQTKHGLSERSMFVQSQQTNCGSANECKVFLWCKYCNIFLISIYLGIFALEKFCFCMANVKLICCVKMFCECSHRKAVETTQVCKTFLFLCWLFVLQIIAMKSLLWLLIWMSLLSVEYAFSLYHYCTVTGCCQRVVIIHNLFLYFRTVISIFPFNKSNEKGSQQNINWQALLEKHQRIKERNRDNTFLKKLSFLASQ